VKDYINDLNDVQRNAVEHVDGPSLVIAGAGSGKTRVLTYRIAHLLASGVPAHKILALTFTNKAAKEMKERIANLVGRDKSKYLWMGTFHSIFSRILRTESAALGYKSSFTIYDTADTKSLLKTIIKERKLDDQIYKPGEMYARISSAKNALITPAVYEHNSDIIARDRSMGKPEIATIYRYYMARCKKADAMDFDDLLLNTNILFKDFPDILSKYQKTFQYILVDEYQDTNYSQYLIIKKLGANHNNVSVVGDDSQSIYSFRGAKIENILNFKSDYPEYKLFKLEQNYRSTKTIVDAANSLIEKNQNRIPKVVFSKNDIGDNIKVLKANTDNEESYLVVNEIFDTIYNNQTQYQDFAILYRTNAQSRVFEEALRRRNIPYKIYGGLSFYQRKEIKDVLSYLRLVINPDDEEALKRVINYPSRGIGQTTVGKIIDAAEHYKCSIWYVLTNLDKIPLNVNTGTANKLINFTKLIKSFQDKVDNTDAYTIALEIATTSGIMKDLMSEKTPEGISRYENLQELLNSIKEFTEREKEDNEGDMLVEFIENVSLLTDADNEKDEDRNRVTLMTIHSAKGLEFKYVYVVGMEEDLFPSRMSINTAQEIEEERRLFYVALTRAEIKCTLAYSVSRYKWGSLISCTPSRFIREIDPKFVELPVEEEVATESFENEDEGDLFNFTKRKTFKSKPIRKTETVQPISSRKLTKINVADKKKVNNENFKSDDPSNIKSGMNVEHQRFGKGKVLKLEGTPPNIKATVFFPNSGQKQLLLKFAKLKIID
jgi:ATP-dependent DNA helicase UvrD/PcrA